MKNKTKDNLAFLFGLGCLTQIRIIGAMGITELVSLIVFPFIFLKFYSKGKNTLLTRLLLLLILWFLSALATDFFYRHTNIYDALRGCMSIPFFIVTMFCAFALLYDDLLRLKWLALGVAFSSFISLFFFQAATVIAKADSWGVDTEDIMDFKSVYVGLFARIALVLYAWLYKSFPLAAIMVSALFSFVCLVYGSRSVFLISFVVLGASFLFKFSYSTMRKLQKNFLFFVIVATVAILCVKNIYVFAVKEGFLGEDELAKYESQSRSKIGLLSGRASVVGSLLAVKDSPILGHGSWARDVNDYRGQMYALIGDSDALEMHELFLKSGSKVPYLPTHSHIWQAWAWHGLLGGYFWLYVLFLLIRYIMKGVHLCKSLFMYNIAITLSAAWSVMFSPISNRGLWGAILATIILTFAEISRRKKVKSLGLISDVNSPWNGKPTL